MLFPRKMTVVMIIASLFVLTACSTSNGDSNSDSNNSAVTDAPDEDASTDVPPTDVPATDVAATETDIPATAEPTATKVTIKVEFDYVTEFGTSEEIEPLLEDLLTFDGVLAASGSVFSVSITYDPDILTEDELRGILSEIGRPVKDE